MQLDFSTFVVFKIFEHRHDIIVTGKAAFHFSTSENLAKSVSPTSTFKELIPYINISLIEFAANHETPLQNLLILATFERANFQFLIVHAEKIHTASVKTRPKIITEVVTKVFCGSKPYFI